MTSALAVMPKNANTTKRGAGRSEPSTEERFFEGSRPRNGSSEASVGGGRVCVEGSRATIGGDRMQFGRSRRRVEGSRATIGGDRMQFGGSRLRVEGGRATTGGSRLRVERSRSLVGSVDVSNRGKSPRRCFHLPLH